MTSGFLSCAVCCEKGGDVVDMFFYIYYSCKRSYEEQLHRQVLAHQRLGVRWCVETVNSLRTPSEQVLSYPSQALLRREVLCPDVSRLCLDPAEFNCSSHLAFKCV